MKDLINFINEALKISKDSKVDNLPKIVSDTFRAITFGLSTQEFDKQLKEDDLYVKGHVCSDVIINYLKKILGKDTELVDGFDIYATPESKEFFHKKYADKIDGNEIIYKEDELSLRYDVYIPGYFSLASDKEELVIYVSSEGTDD